MENDQTVKKVPLESLLTLISEISGMKITETFKGHPDFSKLRLEEVGFDSLALLECGIRLENDFQIAVNPSHFALSRNTTVGDLYAFISGEAGVEA